MIDIDEIIYTTTLKSTLRHARSVKCEIRSKKKKHFILFEWRFYEKKLKWTLFICRRTKKSIIWLLFVMIFSNESKHAFYLKQKLDEWLNFFEKTSFINMTVLKNWQWMTILKTEKYLKNLLNDIELRRWSRQIIIFKLMK